MASLTGQLVAETYKALLKTIDNDILTASEKQITDGFGGGSNVFIDSQGFLRANKYKVTNGLATQFLKADGSLDANTYLTGITSSQIISALGYTPVPTTRTLTINGTTYDLSANRSWTIDGTSAVWGNISGTLSNQTDLQNALNAKYNNPTGTISQYIRGDGSLATFPTLTGFVPYTGATANVDLGEFSLSAEYLAIDTDTTHSTDVGEIVWNPIDGTFDMGLLNGVVLQAGQELHFYGKASGAIGNGKAVMFAGVEGDHLLMSLADPATINANPQYFIGVATQDFANNDFGYVTILGKVRNIDTTAFTLGSVLYFDSASATDGLLTETQPIAPNAKIEVAAVVRVHATQGTLMVRPHIMPKMSMIQDVYIADPANNHGLFYDLANGYWENKSIASALGYTPQAQLDGTGFVKASGTTISYDNSTYLTTTDAASTYQRLDKMVSNLLASATEYPNSNAVIAALALKANAENPVFTGNMTISGAEPKLYFTDTDQNPDYFIGADAGFFRIYDQTAGATRFVINSSGVTTIAGDLIVGTIAKSGGTATQFLKADGSIDSSTYVTSASLANYLLITTAASTYQRLDKMVSNLLASDTEYPNSNAVLAKLALKADAANPVFTGDMTISGISPKLYFTDTDNNPDYTLFVDSGYFYIYDQTAGATKFQITPSGNAINTGTLTSASFIKSGGTSSQFLMADGSVSTGPNLSAYLPLAGGTMTGQLISSYNTGGEPYVNAIFRAVGGSNIGGILVNGTTQAHIRFQVGSTTWDGSGSKQWQIRVGNGGGEDNMKIYSWTKGGDTMTILNNGNTTIHGTLAATNLSGTNTGDQTLAGLGGVGGTGSTGYIPKWSATSTIANSTLYTDGTYFGINNTSPNTLLHLIAWSGDAARIKLQSGATAASMVDFTNGTTARWTIGIDNNQTYGKLENRVLATDAIRFYDASNNLVLNVSSGNTMIGTSTDAGYKLDVLGSARFTSAVVESSGLNIKGTAVAKPAMLRLSNAADQPYFWDIWRDNTTGYLNFGGATGGSVSTFLTIRDVTGIASFSGSVNINSSSAPWGNPFINSTLQIGNGSGFLVGRNDSFNNIQLGSGAYYNGTNWVFSISDYASRMSQYNGNISLENTLLGTSGNSATFISRLFIGSNGNVGINTNTPTDYIDGESGMTILQSTNGRAVLSLTGTRVDAGEALGRLSFTNTNATTAGSKRLAHISGYRGTTNNSAYLEFATANDSIGVGRMWLSQQGNLGIGVVSPVNKLHIQSSTAQTDSVGYMQLEYTSSAAGNAGLTTKNYYGTGQFMQWESYGLRIGSRILTNSGTGHLFFTSGADSVAMVIRANGNTIIGGSETDSGYKLDVVAGGDANNYCQLRVKGAGSYPSTMAGILLDSASAQSHLRFAVSGDVKFQIRYNEGGSVTNTLGFYSFPSGQTVLSLNATTNTATFYSSVTATSFFESSDMRLKTLIDESAQVAGIENLEAKLYEKNGKIELGYFAQDAEKLMPYAVTKNADGFLSLSYREVHTAKIARLEKRVAELEKQLNLN